MTSDQKVWDRGYIQVYTGDGKGKSTAAFGLALRAAGARLPVFIAQFVKGMRYSEIEAFEQFPNLITMHQYGRGCFIHGAPQEEDKRAARDGLAAAREALCSGSYKVVILDEANIATFYRLFEVDDLLELMDAKPDHVELVITGRKADARVLERADLVTEMQEVKHYYTKGVEARKGIES